MSATKEWVIADVQPDGTPWFYTGMRGVAWSRTNGMIYDRKSADFRSRHVVLFAFANARRVIMHVDDYEACVAMLHAANAMAP